jgi:hypothetical protein
MDKLVIPAKAGIQSAASAGSRVKPGMTAATGSVVFIVAEY